MDVPMRPINANALSLARYAVELGYHTSLLKDAIAAYSWEEIKATVEVNFPAYGHTVLSTEEFINTLNTK